jgi:uncharacterized protein (TIGR02996 family)
MDRVVAARKLVAELVKSNQLEVRRVEIVAKDLAALIEELNRPPSGRELEAWLDDHAQVDELYANENVLEELTQRHLAPPPSTLEAPEVRHAELEQRIREAPDAGESYQIYGDWLQEQGDPFGELIALGIAGITGERLERFRATHHARFFGGMAKDLLRRVHLHWKHGLVHTIEESVEHGMLGPFEWARLLQLRVCGFVQTIKLLQACTDELDRVIAEHAPTTLDALEVYAGSGSVPARLFERPLRSLVVTGHNVTLGEHLPKSLERLELRVHVLAMASPIALDIRELSMTLSVSTAQHLADAQLPKLERLILTSPSADVVLRVPDFPVTHLEVRDGSVAAPMVAAFASLSAVRLTSLALINVELDDATAYSLAAPAHREAFAKLATLDVSFNELTRAGLAALQDLGPTIISTRQYRPGNSTERRIRAFAGSRWQAAEDISEMDNWRDSGIDGDLRWAHYRGSDHYELFVYTDLERYGCTCPSSIQPCKHVVALALIAERTTLAKGPSNGIERRLMHLDPMDEP